MAEQHKMVSYIVEVMLYVNSTGKVRSSCTKIVLFRHIDSALTEMLVLEFYIILFFFFKDQIQ